MGLLRRNRRPDVVIDLRESTAPWGSPAPCPECSGRGYLDHIDPFKKIMYLHCTRCSAKYALTRSEVDGAIA